MAKSLPIEATDLYPRATARGLEIHPATVRALRLFSCQDETRVHLNGIGVDIPRDRDQAWLCATDGHRAIRIPILGAIPDGVRPNWNPGELAQSELRARLRDVEGKTTTGAQLLVLPWIGGDCMAPISQVIPSDHDRPQRRSDLSLAFNPAYVADVAKAGEILGKACRSTVVLRVGALPNGALSPTRFDLVVLTSNVDGIVIAQTVVMPMREGAATLPPSHHPKVVVSEVAEAPEIVVTDIAAITKARATGNRKRQPIAKVAA